MSLPLSMVPVLAKTASRPVVLLIAVLIGIGILLALKDKSAAPSTKK